MANQDRDRPENYDVAISEGKRFFFRLYVSEENVTAAQAIKNLRSICQALGEEQCEVEIIDVHAQPKRAEKDRVFAIPTLIKSEPLPVVRILGDLRDGEKILSSFGYNRPDAY